MDVVTARNPDKRVLLLTATPVHTGLRDLTNLLRVMTKNRRDVWAPAIADFESYLRRVEKRDAEAFPVLDRSVVRRSRTDLVRAQEERRAAGIIDPALSLPARRPGHVTYEYSTDDGDVFTAFARIVEHLELAPYDLERFRLGRGSDDVEPSALTGLFLAGLLKRFESSLRAVAISLARLEVVLDRSLQALSGTPPGVLDLHDAVVRRLLERDCQGDDDEETDTAWDASLATGRSVDPTVYDVAAIRQSMAADLAAVRDLRAALPLEAADGKIAALIELLTDPKQLGQKDSLVFTQFRDTAEYLAERLGSVGLNGIGLVHGGTPDPVREHLTRWFDPGSMAPFSGEDPIRILVSTDVLAEGHNLQRAAAVVNFDLHWNPQVVVQRAGRIDRLNSPHAVVHILSFLPEEGLEAHLGLVRTLDRRFGLIHYLGLGDEPVTAFRNDFQMTTFEQLRRLYGDDPSIFDEMERTFVLGSTDYMREPLARFLQDAGQEKLRDIPVGVQSVRYTSSQWTGGPGTFIAFRVGDRGEGETIWRFYRDDSPDPITDETLIFRAIACQRWEPPGELPDGENPASAVALIDWELLKRAANSVMDAVNARRATAQMARGSSERSRKTRSDLLLCAQALQYSGDDLNAVLDRLEEVHIEDFDHRAAYKRFRDAFRAARDPQQSTIEGRRYLGDALAVARDLLGDPRPDHGSESAPITTNDIVLVAWERVIVRDSAREPENPTRQGALQQSRLCDV